MGRLIRGLLVQLLRPPLEDLAVSAFALHGILREIELV